MPPLPVSIFVPGALYMGWPGSTNADSPDRASLPDTALRFQLFHNLSLPEERGVQL